MDIIYFGTPEFSVAPLKALYEHEKIKIKAVFTQPDKEVGRKRTITPPPVKKLALDLAIPVFQPKNKKELSTFIQGQKCDFFIVIAYGMIIPEEILKIPKKASINVHTSLLPKYRGASPIQEALLHGDAETGISIMKMDEKLDHGPIYLIKRINIDYEDNYETLSNKLSVESSKILPKILDDIINNELKPIPQNHDRATFCHKIDKKDGEIDPKIDDAITIKNKLRAFTPWPGIHIKFNEKNIKILKLEITEDQDGSEPGKWTIKDKQILIQTKKGIIIPHLLQPEGKKPMDQKSFINGYM